MVLSNKIIIYNNNNNFICTHLHWMKSVSSLKLTGLTYSVPWCTYRDSNQSTRPKELLVYIDLPLLVSYTHWFFYFKRNCTSHMLVLRSIFLIKNEKFLSVCSVGFCRSCGVGYSWEDAQVGLQESSLQSRNILVT